MNSKQIKVKMQGVLAVCEQTMTDYGINVERENSGVNPDIDILTSEFKAGINNDPVLSNIYFLPVPPTDEEDPDPDILYLVQALTIRDDIETNEQRVMMLQALNYINFHVPYGTFVMDEALETVTYRNLIHLYEGLDDADMSLFIMRELIGSLGIIGLYVSAINALADGAISWEDFIEIVSAYTEKQQ